MGEHTQIAEGLEELAPLSVRENARFHADEPLFSEVRMATTLSR